MNLFLPFFAQDILPELVPQPWHKTGARDILIILGVLVVLTVLVLIWAAYFRKRDRDHSHHHHHHHRHQEDSAEPAAASDSPPSEPGEASGRHHRRRRRRRREHRPRNPTLAETGGLPPLRSQNRSEPLP
ncbi:MAG TPA: hypothetical protein VG146_19935 [Verrucomicrobiae bacterium]|nr:hypothetical protein [Verrucomicrobiae bacterium]